tara:strand:- start:1239 stop:1508 length:270 start_codon:yes stop_codon:yes gene_type:complete
MRSKKEKERKSLYDRLFESEDGQRLLEDLARRNHVFDVVTVENPQISAFRDGRRSVVVDIINYLGLNTSDLERLARESIDGNRSEFDPD